MREFPFEEYKIGTKSFIREFKHDTDSEELIWHQDREDRKITIVEANGWLLQFDKY